MPTPENGETIPLLTMPHSQNFFQKSIKNLKKITFKTVGVVSASAVSVVTYYKPAYDAGASIATWLKWPALISGVGTNFFFNIQAYQELLAQSFKLLKMPWQLTGALFFSTMCVAPNLFMNIVDEEGNYIDGPNMAFQTLSAFLNIGVNVVGSMALINNISSLLKNKTDLQKEKLIEEINFIIEQFSQSQAHSNLNKPLDEQSQVRLISLLTANNKLNLKQKIKYYLLNTSLGIFSIPQFSAYLLISYFGMYNLAKKKLDTTEFISLLLGLIAAIGNGIPGAGFSIKGVNYISKKLIALEKISLLSTLFVLLSLFSGFNTHKAMADSLKELEYSGSIAELLKWSANLGAALIYNAPQIAALANSLSIPVMNHELKELKKHLEASIKNLHVSNIQNYKHELPNTVSEFFSKPSEIINLSQYPTCSSFSIN